MRTAGLAISGLGQYPYAHESSGGFRQYACLNAAWLVMFKKSIIVWEGIVHVAFVKPGSPKHSGRVGNWVVSNADMMSRERFEIKESGDKAY